MWFALLISLSLYIYVIFILILYSFSLHTVVKHKGEQGVSFWY